MHTHARLVRFTYVALLAFLGCLTLPDFACTQSGFYRFIDENGQVRYTDNPANIPPDQYQDMPLDVSDYNSGPAADKRKPDSIAPQRIVVNYDAKGGMILVNAVLDRHYPVVFHLDTGATSTMITENDARMLNLPLDSAKTVSGLIADGSIVEMPVVHLNSIGLGDAVVNNLDVTVGKVRLLGMDFLENFDLNINAQVGQVVLVTKDPATGNGQKRELESDTVRQDREQARRDISNQISQFTIAIKTFHTKIEEYQGDIEEMERELEIATASLSTTRKQTRFQGSGVSRDRWDQASITRLEKYTKEIEDVIQNRLDLIKLNEEKISGMKSRINHLRTLRSRMN